VQKAMVVDAPIPIGDTTEEAQVLTPRKVCFIIRSHIAFIFTAPFVSDGCSGGSAEPRAI
jgi:hypothetical protein